MRTRYVYCFGAGRADGSKEDKDLLGGKGANLAEMVRLGIPVPPGFTITTAVCREYLASGRYPAGLEEQVAEALAWIEEVMGRRFGAADDFPLLLSARSGAAISMPGMMDTILNLGLNDDTTDALARATRNERFAFDSYRRFVQMYGSVVMGVADEAFKEIMDHVCAEAGARDETGLDADALREVVRRFKARVREDTGQDFPDEPDAQLWGAIEAVFRSWRSERAIAYRRLEGIDENLGTAVTVMAMVFGNLGEDSGTGVAFTRDPNTGEKRFFGEFLYNAQGEDVVAGIRTPLPIERMADRLPDAYEELLRIQARLEQHYRDMQDLEFTVEQGKLYLLQTRNGKRTARAAVRIAVDMVNEGLVSEAEAVLRMDPYAFDHLLHPQIDPKAKPTVLATGLPASPGAASGRVVLDPHEAVELAEQGEAVVLVRPETSADDFPGMAVSRAIVTTRGGMTSHAAVVARGIGKCCVVGAHDLTIDRERGVLNANGMEVARGDWITVDGSEGRVLLGKVPTVDPEPTPEFDRFMEMVEHFRTMGVRANAEDPEDARKALEFGAEGIGLCRTEHMFFKGDRIHVVREMILAEDEGQRRRALEKLLPMQRDDFAVIFRVMNGLPVTIRLLDPPLHEFLPHPGEETRTLAERLGMDPARVEERVERHRELNPMLGHRGVRLGISHPEITEMQVRAIFEAAVQVTREGVVVRPEIMVPLVAHVEELRRQAALIRETADGVLKEAGVEVPYLVGTMIELPRAAVTAAEIAKEAQFFSFGTNDLTQTVYGISRDDAGTFLPHYLQERILPADPFQILDREGVGWFVEYGVREGRRGRPDLKIGICGEHGGDPKSIEFFFGLGLDYVSCSPFRVPVARLAAAQAALRASRSAPGVPWKAAAADGVEAGGAAGRATREAVAEVGP